MTPRYSNGRFPLSLFIHRGGNIYLTPSLNARWDEMVRLAIEKYGVRLYITGDIDGLGGWNGYRPWDPQGRYKTFYGKKAAAQGYSSHGGVYRGQEVFALDIANVDALAPNNPSLAHARLTALAKAVGLTVNFVSPTEWWHVGDFNDAWSAPAFGQVAVNPGTTNRPEPSIVTGAEMYIIRAAGRTPTLVGAGYVRTLNEEEAANLGAIVSKDTTVNARQFDLAVSAVSTGSVSGPSEGAFVISSPNRKKTLIDAGFVRQLNDEELANASIYFTNRQYVVNDRQFDLAVSVALTGEVPKVR